MEDPAKMLNDAKKEKPECASFVLLEDGLAELVYDQVLSKTQFAVYKGGSVEYRDHIMIRGKTVRPFPPTKNALRNNVVYFPSKAEEYGSDKELLKDIQDFIHRYLQVSPLFEKIMSHYVLFTWVYDNFNELPYLRFLADWGCGKSRGIKTVGLLCYKPIFAGGSTTSSPIFRLLQEFPGTFIIDEADFSNSDMHSDIIKILNCGYEKGLPVLRSEGSNGKFETKSFPVYGPKILATREEFKDQALESRCLTERIERLTRTDISPNLPDIYWAEALAIRNKLLMWRFRNYGKRKINPDLIDEGIEPRLNQILLPLLSIVDDKDVKNEIRQFMREYNLSLYIARGLTFEAEVLGVVMELIKTSEPSMGEIEIEINQRNGNTKGNRSWVSAKKIGGIIRKLNVEPRRKGGNGAYIIPKEENEKIHRAGKRYGFSKEGETDSEHVNVVNVVEIEGSNL